MEKRAQDRSKTTEQKKLLRSYSRAGPQTRWGGYPHNKKKTHKKGGKGIVEEGGGGEFNWTLRQTSHLGQTTASVRKRCYWGDRNYRPQG